MIVRERNVGVRSVRPSYMSAEEVYDRARCRRRKCTTELHGGVYRHTRRRRRNVQISFVDVYTV